MKKSRHPTSILFFLALLLLSIIVAADPQLFKRDYANRNYYAIELADENIVLPSWVAEMLDVRLEGRVGELKNYFLFSTLKTDLQKRSSTPDDVVQDPVLARLGALRAHTSLAKRDQSTLDGILDVAPQKLRKRVKRAVLPEHLRYDLERRQIDLHALAQDLKIPDPGIDKQWHLVNNDELGSDINVTGVWEQGITGQGIIVAIVDDGLDNLHEDLEDAYYAAGSYDFNDHTETPRPRLLDDTHGTRCAGEIAARRNEVCGIGVAYDSQVSGLRILSAEITDADEAAALNYHYQENHIYSCSWGPPDDGQSADAPQGVILKAIINGVENGRNGSGTIFVFASGNGGASDDNCNFDGYTNSMYTITVGAIDRLGNHPFYSERCAAQLVVTYSSGSGSFIYTTDVGPGRCTQRHGGTSAAAPIAAGIFALVLSVRSDLSWRDMQHLCVQTAVYINPDDDDWQLLPSGRRFNHKYGYGKLDAHRIVEAAMTYEKVGPQVCLEMPLLTIDQEIPDTDEGLLEVLEVKEIYVNKAALLRLEHVTVTVNIQHQSRGDLELYLVSPNGIVSQLAAQRRFDKSEEGLLNWTFMSVKHWDENPIGNWSLRVLDRINPSLKGRFVDWQIKFWGERDPAFVGEPTVAPVEEGVVLPTETVTAPVAATETETQNQHLTTSSHALETTTTSPAASPSVVSTATNTFDAKPGGMLEDIEKPEQTTASHGSTSTIPSEASSSAAATAGSSKKSSGFFFYAIAGSSLIVVVAGLAYFTKRGRLDKRGGGGGGGGGGSDNGYEFEVLTNEPDDGVGGDHLSSSPMLGRDRRDSTEMREIGERYRDYNDEEGDDRLDNGNGNGVRNGNGNGNGVANGKKKQSGNGKVEVMFDRGDLDEFLTSDDEADVRGGARGAAHTREQVITPGGSTEAGLARNTSWGDFTPLVRAHEDEQEEH